MLEYPLKHCPELILLGMAHIHTASSLIPYEVASAVFHLVLKSTAGKSSALCLWNINPNLLLRGFIDSLKMDPVHVTSVLNLSQELKIFPRVLELLPLCFGIRLATFASDIELLDLEKWITVNLTTYKEIFFKECLKFLKEAQSAADRNLSYKTRSVFFKALQAHTGVISPGHLSEELEKLHQMFMDADGCIQFSNELGIEAEADSYFKKLFSGQLPVETMVQILAQFKVSSEKRITYQVLCRYSRVT
jgi:CCR4-NOT transcription complex subunit 1